MATWNNDDDDLDDGDDKNDDDLYSYKNDDLDKSDPVCEVRSVISRIAAQLSFPKTFVFMLQCNGQIMIIIAVKNVFIKHLSLCFTARAK